MVNPVAMLHSIEGFKPLPTSVTIPFMTAQSGSMMLAAGFYWQFGKRFVDAMSNEQFNSLVDDVSGTADLVTGLTGSTVASFMKDENLEYYRAMQKDVMDEMVELEKLKLAANVRLFKEMPKEYFQYLGEIAHEDAEGVRGDIEGILTKLADWAESLSGRLPGATTPPTEPHIPAPEPPPTEPYPDREPEPEKEPEPPVTPETPVTIRYTYFNPVTHFKKDVDVTVTKTKSEHKNRLDIRRRQAEDKTGDARQKLLNEILAYSMALHAYYGEWM